ncbi:MAG: 2-oxo acid dehydrogenase subunit E2 [Akkermansia sp.]
MSPLRRTIAARLAQVQHQAAILTTFNECDMSAVMELRRQFNASFREGTAPSSASWASSSRPPSEIKGAAGQLK